MRFCTECQSHLNKSTATGTIIFHCRCMAQYPGNPEHTLMSEGYLEASESNMKHETFIENSPYDPVRNIVLKDCPDCGLNFMTMIRVGSQELMIFVCDCGARYTLEEYATVMEKKEKKPPVVKPAEEPPKDNIE